MATLRACLLYACLPLWGQATQDEGASSTDPATADQNRPPPAWFLDQRIEHEDWEDVGYGQGETLEQAYDRAVLNVARKSIPTQVDRVTRISQGTTPRGEVVDERMHELVTSIKGELSNLEVKREEQRGGTYFVAVLHDGSSVYEKVVRHIKRRNTRGNCVRSTLRTKFSNSLMREFGCVPKWELDFKADTKRWQLLMAGLTPPPILREVDDLEWFLPVRSNVRLNIRLSTTEVESGEERYTLTIDHRRAGWLYLFIVTDQGQVRRERFGMVAAGQRTRYPDPRGDFYLLSEIDDEVRDSAHEYFLAVLCDREIGDYQSIGRDLSVNRLDVDDSLTYRYGTLLEALKRQSCMVDSSILAVTKSRSPGAVRSDDGTGS